MVLALATFAFSPPEPSGRPSILATRKPPRAETPPKSRKMRVSFGALNCPVAADSPCKWHVFRRESAWIAPRRSGVRVPLAPRLAPRQTHGIRALARILSFGRSVRPALRIVRSESPVGSSATPRVARSRPTATSIAAAASSSRAPYGWSDRPRGAAARDRRRAGGLDVLAGDWRAPRRQPSGGA